MTSLSTLARAARLGSARKRGVTLIEAVLYISIALALIVGGLVFFQQASLAQRTNSAVRNISAIASETRGLYQASSSFAGFTETALIDAGAIPSTLISGAGLINEWGGAVTAAAATVDGATDDGFSVLYQNVPPNACTRLVTYDGNGAGRIGAGIDEIRVRAGNATTAAATNTATTGGLTPTEAATLCSNAGTADTANGQVDIEYRFDR